MSLTPSRSVLTPPLRGGPHVELSGDGRRLANVPGGQGGQVLSRSRPASLGADLVKVC